MVNLRRAVQLGQHRLLIDSLTSMLSVRTHFAITAESILELGVCSAFSDYLITLEQICHWPRDDSGISTPELHQDHKLAIQVLHEPELGKTLKDETRISFHYHIPHPARQVAQAALAMAGRMLCEQVRLANCYHRTSKIVLTYCIVRFPTTGSYRANTTILVAISNLVASMRSFPPKERSGEFRGFLERPAVSPGFKVCQVYSKLCPCLSATSAGP
jgi:hypothetical protein